ncbi:hypothetical protein [Lysinibacillus sp. 38-6]|uniref:hypothetical protein n=1 Tax=Lysinibacillus sp. 38-6 TaxID=3385991 RepID=UPI0039089161
MVVNLTAVFRMQDRGSDQLRRISQMTSRLSSVMRDTTTAVNSTQQAISQVTRTTTTAASAITQTQEATSRAGAVFRSVNGSIHQYTQSTRNASSASTSLNGNLNGVRNTLIGLVGAYASVQTAQSLFKATIGEAMKFEQSRAIIKSVFQDDGASKQYMEMVDKFAIDSPLLNSGDMFGSSKGLLMLTKSMPQLESAWSIVERLIASDPTKSIDDAVRGMRELASGDIVSLKEVFNLDKNILNDVKGGSFEEQLAGLDKALTQMNITQKTIEAMGSTSLGLWSQIGERAGKFFRIMGGEGNEVLGAKMKEVVDKLDSLNLDDIAIDLGAKLADGFQKGVDAINFVKTNMDDFKATIGFVKEAVIGLGTAIIAHKAIVGAMTIYSTITTLMTAYRAGTLLTTAATLGFNAALWANPVTWVVGAIAGLVGIGVLLYRNWDVVTAKTKEVWSAIGGLQGAVSLVLGPIGFLITAGIDLAKNWDSTKSVWTNVWSAIQRSAASSVNAVIGLINEMIATINKIPGVNIPIVAKVNWGATTEMLAAKATSNRGMIPGHYHGLNNVPYDNYLSYLHKGEMVLPRFEAEAYRRKSGVDGVSYNEISTVTYKTTTNNHSTSNNAGGQGFNEPRVVNINPTINMPGMVVREDADITRIADQLVAKLLEKRGVV